MDLPTGTYGEGGSNEEYVSGERNLMPKIKIAIAVLAVAYVVFSAYGFYRTASIEQRMHGQIAQLQQRVNTLEASNQTIASRMGVTQKEIEQRAAALQKAQRAAESRLAAQQKEQISAVSGDMAGIKTELGSFKTDASSLRTDLEATKARLDQAIGDLGVQSGLIAHTRDELQVLKHRGDRNYYEFSLAKGKPTPVGTISLELRKANVKKSRFTLNVLADDRTIEKKDRTANEPLQFYTGRERLLYEIVVNTVEKNRVAGYLATPKGAPAPVVIAQ
jgi:DNA repair exonuclease SbcCD ATPase subunit